MSTPTLTQAPSPATLTAMRPLILPSRGALFGGAARKPSGGHRIGSDALRRPSNDRCAPSSRKGGRRSTSAQAHRRIVSPAGSELTASAFLLSYVKSTASPIMDNSAESSADEMAPNAPVVMRSRRSKRGNRGTSVSRRARSETFSFPKPPKALPVDSVILACAKDGLGIDAGLASISHDSKAPLKELPEGLEDLLEAARADEKLMAEIRHGLTGSQGWSPNTPDISAFPDVEDVAAHHPVHEINLPIVTEPSVMVNARPLRLSKKKRPTSAESTGSAPSEGGESWTFSTSSGSAIGSPRKRATAPRLNSLPPAYTGDLARRSVSAPALHPPAYTPGWEEEPEEYPFPLMADSERRGSADSNASSVADEDTIKLARLNASLSLLGAGTATHLHGPSVAPAPSRFQLQYTLGLEEQMAFACGAGSDFEWASSDEAEGRRASAASEYLPKRRNAAKREAMVLPRPNSSPLRLSLGTIDSTVGDGLGLDSFEQGQVAVVGSSWSECGGDLLSRANSMAGYNGARQSGSMLQRADSTASSCLSANWSPIITERLSASSLARAYEEDGERLEFQDRPMTLVAVEELFDGPLPQLTPVPAGPSTPELVKDTDSDATSPSSSSPSLLCDAEFSYLMSEALAADVVQQSDVKLPSTLQAQRLPSRHQPMATEPCRIFTPALTTPELERSLNASNPMDSLPSPRIAPAHRPGMTSSMSMPSFALGEGPIITITPPSEASMSRQASSIMPASASSSSVLCRPRPVARGGAFAFGNTAADAERSVSASLPRTPRRPTTASASIVPGTSSTTTVKVPQRKSSLDLNRASPMMPRSPSSSSGPIRVLSPESLARLRLARDREVERMRSGGKRVRSVRFSCDVEEEAKQQQVQGGMTSSASAFPLLAKSPTDTAGIVAAPRMISRKPVPSIATAPIPTSLRPAVGILSTPSEAPGTQTRQCRQQQQASNVSRPSSSSTMPPHARSHGMSTSASLPTLFVARTPSQRKRGETGLRQTDPRNLALAKMGISTICSHVEALAPASSTSAVQQQSKKEKRRSTLSASAEPLPTPSGMILVVEETKVSYEHVVTSFA